MTSSEATQLTFVPAALLALVIAALVNNPVLSAITLIAFFIYALLQEKNALILLFIYFPIRPFLVEFNPQLKIVGDIIIAVLVMKVIYRHRKNWRSLFQFQWFELAFFCFCLIGAVSALLTGVTAEALILQLRSFLLFYLVFYVIKRMEINKEDVWRFLWATFITAFIICLHGLIEKISLRGWLLPESWESMPLSSINRIRIYGLIGNPNLLAYYLSFAFVLTIYLKKYVKGKMGLFLNFSLILMMGVWFLTYSRGTWIAFGIGLIIYIWLSKNWQVLKFSILTVMAGIVLIGLPTNLIAGAVENSNFGVEQRSEQKQFDQRDGGFSDRMRETFNDEAVEGSRSAGRLYILEKGLDVFLEHPIIGTGFATFGDSATLNAGSPIYSEYDIDREFYSDNQYIQIIVQTGTFGVIVFAVFLLNMLYVLWKRKETNPAVVMIAVLLGSYAAGLVYNIWENDAFTLYYFAILAFIIGKSKEGAKAKAIISS